jgi:hypothetical protein
MARPPKAEKSLRIESSISPTLFNKLQERAGARGITISELIRTVATDYILSTIS